MQGGRRAGLQGLECWSEELQCRAGERPGEIFITGGPCGGED